MAGCPILFISAGQFKIWKFLIHMYQHSLSQVSTQHKNIQFVHVMLSNEQLTEYDSFKVSWKIDWAFILKYNKTTVYWNIGQKSCRGWYLQNI